LWQHALILGFVCERLSFACGGTYFDVLKWLPVLKHYEPLLHQPAQAGTNQWRVYGAQLSALTHVVYTLSDYDQLRLSPGLLPEEFAFLRSALAVATRVLQLPEAIGEVADCLKTFGLSEATDASLAEAAAFQLQWQNADGSWGLPQERMLGTAYHTTLVAMWGLRDPLPRAAGPLFAELLPALQLWAAPQPLQAPTARHPSPPSSSQPPACPCVCPPGRRCSQARRPRAAPPRVAPPTTVGPARLSARSVRPRRSRRAAAAAARAACATACSPSWERCCAGLRARRCSARWRARVASSVTTCRQRPPAPPRRAQRPSRHPPAANE